jgi:hypothetical protein
VAAVAPAAATWSAAKEWKSFPVSVVFQFIVISFASFGPDGLSMS